MFGKLDYATSASPVRPIGGQTTQSETVANLKPITDGWMAPVSAAGRVLMRLVTMILVIVAIINHADRSFAAEGELTLKVIDESTGEPTAARVELTRPALTVRRGVRSPSRNSSDRIIRPLPARGTLSTGFGFVLQGSVDLQLKEGPYEFRVTRGPESRVVSGNFTIEKTSRDEHTVMLPNMLDMRSRGWTSGDCLIAGSDAGLPDRMDAENLYLARTTGSLPHAVASNEFAPRVIQDGVKCFAGLAFYDEFESGRDELDSLQRLAAATDTHVAIENPFAWPVPVFLASDRIDGCFVLGSWLRLDRPSPIKSSGRPYNSRGEADALTVGREAEQVYWNMLEAGLRIAPLAGSGNDVDEHPVGYNRLYVAAPTPSTAGDEAISPVTDAADWWKHAWSGNSFVTNGPLMQPKLNGKLPGHVFEINRGTDDLLTPEITLTVRDPVEYLEVIHNGQIHYSAKLDEFAKQGGRISPIRVRKSGWAIIRIVTRYEGHFRAAFSAPWYFEVDQTPRISNRAVGFFQGWLSDYEAELKSRAGIDLRGYAPFIVASRAFWTSREQSVTAP